MTPYVFILRIGKVFERSEARFAVIGSYVKAWVRIPVTADKSFFSFVFTATLPNTVH